MQKLVTGMLNKGFTLIEILVVIVIIGITMGFALLAFGDFGESKKLLFAVEQLQSALKLTQQQAILETSTFGLVIDDSGYKFLKFQNNSSWVTYSNKGIFKPYVFPPKTHVTLKSPLQGPSKMPKVIIDSSGDITPFTLIVDANKEQHIATLKVFEDGEMKLTRAGAHA